MSTRVRDRGGEDDRQFAMEFARYLSARGRWTEAEVVLRTARQASANWLLVTDLVEVLEDQGKLNAALVELDSAGRQQLDDDAQACWLGARVAILRGLGRCEEALVDLVQLEALEPGENQNLRGDLEAVIRIRSESGTER